ncbi:P-loop containing nucleoside triphosphate hydrolase protein [Aspergillus carlsbadensis]|nr:P-loop containing nucleoside triphosphate hydrolase protein [Aspergillus carlsbadensis]
MSEATDSASLTPTESNLREELICYGALYEARVAHRGNKTSFQRFCKAAGSLERFPVSRKDNCFFIKDQKQKEFAILDTSTTTALDCLKGLEGLTFCAVPRPLTLTQGTSPVVHVSINIYGPLRHHRQVGTLLAAQKHYLQHPDVIEPGMRYDNPQYFKCSAAQADMDQYVKPTHRVRTASQSVRVEIDKLLDTLDTDNLDSEVRSIKKLTTPLLKAQIGFNDSLDGRSGQALGGIIADAMGLGKTLTMISAILFSMDDAEEFMLSTDRAVNEGGFVIPTKSTLVVVPSTREYHIAPNSMHTSVFHGTQKKLQTKEYLASDIVITTYSTLVADYKSLGILHTHWIRNSSSKQFRAVNQLQASRRWCLTGTPIQNRIEDLGSLVAFKQQIIDRLFSNVEDPCRDLRLLLQSLCLRRTKQTDHSITVRPELVTLFLSLEEQMAYSDILEKTRQEMEMLVSNGLGNHKYTKLFTAMHQLRMLCVQGVSSARPVAGTPYLLPVAVAAFPSADVSCELCSSDESLDLLKAGSAFCPDCGRLFSNPKGSPRGFDSSDSIVFSYWTRTLDILCPRLEELGIHYARVDGNVNRADRTRRLSEFQSSPTIPVLLMTYGTGAVGLNLTAANRIHLLEPQWNPSVEEQAIGRAVRLGQVREVTVIRYVMTQTVEENILAIQKNKQQLASFTLESDSSDSLAGRTEVS